MISVLLMISVVRFKIYEVDHVFEWTVTRQMIDARLSYYYLSFEERSIRLRLSTRKSYISRAPKRLSFTLTGHGAWRHAAPRHPAAFNNKPQTQIANRVPAVTMNLDQ